MSYKIDCNNGNVFGKRRGNKKLGSSTKNGYQQVSKKINGERYIHRIIYKTFYQNENIRKDWEIDHINDDKNDNRIQNLRLVKKEYNLSIKVHKNKTSRYVGVCYDKSAGKWKARCNGKHLGYFKIEEDASDSYWDYYQEYVSLYSG